MGDVRIIAGRWKGHRLDVPTGRDVRPTANRVREAWMSVLGPALPGARVVDLFAGSGALGLEALSRGAEHVTFVERGGRQLRCLRENIARFDASDQTSVVRRDVFAFLRGIAPRTFDLGLADPPYGKGTAARLVEAYAASPFARMLSVEHRAGEKLPVPMGVDVDVRRYGGTCVAFVMADDITEEKR